MKIWHNPRCSKSRQTLKILREAGVEPEIRNYLEDPPGPAELDEVLAALGMEPAELARMKEKRARELDLRDRRLSRDEWLRVLSENPILIERPVVVAEDGRAVLGRPPENVEELLAG